jgi:hypothetical protein
VQQLLDATRFAIGRGVGSSGMELTTLAPAVCTDFTNDQNSSITSEFKHGADAGLLTVLTRAS